MKKVFVLIVLILIASVIGGVYGCVHDQITYSISNEYYTKFKFIQFNLEDWGLGRNVGTLELPDIRLDEPRKGVSIVGILATWWFGLLIGIVHGVLGLRYETAKTMFNETMKALMLTLCVAFVFGGLGFIYGQYFMSGSPSNWYLPENVIHKNEFITVGTIHNFSYLGGLVGLIGSVLYFWKKKKAKGK
ncbi:MAG: hypothetical protein P1U56_03080 [Saprospiraceae bacterium]|nr:hypothetical protein [Saprospiraceae bacterium]